MDYGPGLGRMYLHQWLEALQIGDLGMGLGKDLLHFAPELILCFTIVLMLFLRLFTGLNRLHLGSLALVLTVVALLVNWDAWQNAGGSDVMFTGLLAFDNFTLFRRFFLLTFTILIIWLSILTGIPA